MPTRSFSLEASGPPRLELTWGFGWKDLRVSLDGKEVSRIDGGLAILGKGAEVPLPDGASLRVQVIQKAMSQHLDLHVDGKPVPGSGPVPLPRWSYPFIGVCVVIPFATLGGVVPAVIGIGGASAVAAIARDDARSQNIRIAIAASITVTSWILFALFLGVVVGMRS